MLDPVRTFSHPDSGHRIPVTLENVVEAYAQLFLSWIKRLARCNDDDAKEILAEVFLLLAAKPRIIEHWDGERLGIFFVVIKREVIRRAREAAYRPNLITGDVLKDHLPAVDSEEKYWFTEMRDRVRDEVDQLPACQRAVVVGRIYHERTFEEIAAEQNISVGGAYLRWCQARDTPRIRLAGEYGR